MDRGVWSVQQLVTAVGVQQLVTAYPARWVCCAGPAWIGCKLELLLASSVAAPGPCGGVGAQLR